MPCGSKGGQSRLLRAGPQPARPVCCDPASPLGSWTGRHAAPAGSRPAAVRTPDVGRRRRAGLPAHQQHTPAFREAHVYMYIRAYIQRTPEQHSIGANSPSKPTSSFMAVPSHLWFQVHGLSQTEGRAALLQYLLYKEPRVNCRSDQGCSASIHTHTCMYVCFLYKLTHI